jgi:hypothetical protein
VDERWREDRMTERRELRMKRRREDKEEMKNVVWMKGRRRTGGQKEESVR